MRGPFLYALRRTLLKFLYLARIFAFENKGRLMKKILLFTVIAAMAAFADGDHSGFYLAGGLGIGPGSASWEPDKGSSLETSGALTSEVDLRIGGAVGRSEEHTSELQSPDHL